MAHRSDERGFCAPTGAMTWRDNVGFYALHKVAHGRGDALLHPLTGEVIAAEQQVERRA